MSKVNKQNAAEYTEELLDAMVESSTADDYGSAGKALGIVSAICAVGAGICAILEVRHSTKATEMINNVTTKWIMCDEENEEEDSINE